MVDAFCKETESNGAVNIAGTLVLHLLSDVDHGITGRDHVVYDENIHALNGITEEFVSDDGVLTVNDLCIVSSLIECSQRYTEDGSIVHSSADTAFIR